MKNRTIKIFLIFCVIAVAFFLLLNIYLPSRIVAKGPQRVPRAARQISDPGTAAHRHSGTGNKQQKSIAAELGVPPPKTVTLARFDPANIRKQKDKVREIFNVPEAIKAEVDFWIDVYTKYDKSKVVFHNKTDLSRIYSVIDISDIIHNDKIDDEQKYRLKKERVEAEEKRLAVNLSKGERSELRSQTGIRDKFIEGIAVAGRYLGEIEKIFAEYGIPLEITRLAFVESMFNLKALSKFAASGIWQFMPGTGRLFLTMNQVVDERNDPILSTHAAAKHLVRDYNTLHSWPLAINSYNTGRVRIERAVSRLKTKDISKIIKRFDYPGYSFASRNFYPAFLAALTVFENRDQYFGRIEMKEPLTYDVIITPCLITLPGLAGHTGVPPEDLTLLNFHLQEDVVTGRLPLPKGSELKVPAGRGEDFLVAIKRNNILSANSKP